MDDHQQKEFSWRKRLVRILLSVVLLVALFLTICWFLFRSTNSFVIQQLEKKALEQWNANLQLEEYDLEWIRPFPTVRIQIKELSIGNAIDTLHPFLKTNLVTTQLNLWDWQTNKGQFNQINADSLWVHIYKDAEQNSNLTLNKNNTSTKPKPNQFNFKNLPILEFNFLDFHHQNDHNHKWQRAKLEHTILLPQQNPLGDWTLNFESDCFFDGLVFKEKEGGYLMNTQGNLNLNLVFSNKNKTLIWDKSELTVDNQTYFIDGKFHQTAPRHIQFQIKNNAVTTAEVLPLLSKKIRNILRDIKVDQPIDAQFSMHKSFTSNEKGIVTVDFASNDANIELKEFKMSSASFRGRFSNDVNQDGKVDSKSNVVIQQLDGDILGVLPVQMQGMIPNVKYPRVDAVGKMNIDLPRLNELLAQKDKFNFTNGQASVNFQYKGSLVNLLNSPFNEQNIQLTGDAIFNDITVKTDQRHATIPAFSGQLSFNEEGAILDDIFLNWLDANVRISGSVGNLPEFLFYENDALLNDLKLHFDTLYFEKPSTNNLSKTNITNRKKLTPEKLELILRQIASNVNGQFDINVDQLFYDTLFFSDVKSQLSLFTPRLPESIDSSMIRVDHLTANFMGNMPVIADVGFSRDSITDVWVAINFPSAVQPTNFFLPDNIAITKGLASMKIAANVPLRSLFDIKKIVSDIQYQGYIKSNQLDIEWTAFNFPLKKISGQLGFDNEVLNLDSLQFQYQGSPFLLNGNIKDYAFYDTTINKKSIVDLDLKGNFLDFRKNIVTSKGDISKNDFSPPELFRSLDTVFHFATGKVNLLLDSVLTDEHTIHPFLLQTQLLPDEQQHHLLQVDSFNLGFGEKNNINGNAIIRNPDYPTIDAHFKTRMKFSQLGKLLPSKFIDMKDGYFKMDLDYSSPLYDDLTTENYLLNAKVDGSAELVNGTIFYNYRDFTFDNIFGHFSFDEKAIYIRDLDLEVNGNRLIGSGQSIDFFPFFILPNRRANIELDIASPYFDFGKFKAPRSLADSLLAPVFTLVDTTQSRLSKTASLIDQLLDKGSMELSTAIQVLAYKKFIASNVNGKISLQPDSVQLNDLKMDIANGAFTVDGNISNVINHQPKLEIAVEMNENEIQELFRQFENFGQNAIGHKNLIGNASATLQFKTDINSDYSILPNTMNGFLNFKFTDGELKNVTALKSLSGFLFKNRKLDHILLDTLDATMHIRGTTLYIDQFDLRSSSFDLGVQGIYNLDSMEMNRMMFSLPVSNLFRRHISSEQLKSGDSKRKGFPILIESKNRKGKMKFRWKLFHSKKNKRKYQLKEDD